MSWLVSQSFELEYGSVTEHFQSCNAWDYQFYILVVRDLNLDALCEYLHFLPVEFKSGCPDIVGEHINLGEINPLLMWHFPNQYEL